MLKISTSYKKVFLKPFRIISRFSLQEIMFVSYFFLNILEFFWPATGFFFASGQVQLCVPSGVQEPKLKFSFHSTLTLLNRPRKSADFSQEKCCIFFADITLLESLTLVEMVAIFWPIFRNRSCVTKKGSLLRKIMTLKVLSMWLFILKRF